MFATLFNVLLVSILAVQGVCEEEMRDKNGELMVYGDGRPVKRGDTYCGFYSDVYCQNQVGSVHYDVKNGGCFWNYGRYMWCFAGVDTKFRLIQSANNNGDCSCQTACTTWRSHDLNRCWDLDQYYGGPWGTYHFDNDDGACGKNSC